MGVWGRAENCPFVIAVTDVIGKYLGENSTALFQKACSLSDPGELRNMVRDAGFSNITIRAGVKISRHPSLSELLPAYFSIFPVAADIAAMQEEERARMFSCMATSLEDYREKDGLAVPTENYILTAQTRQS